MRLDRILSLEDFEHAARDHLARPVFAYVSGGVEDDAALRSEEPRAKRFRTGPLDPNESAFGSGYRNAELR